VPGHEAAGDNEHDRITATSTIMRMVPIVKTMVIEIAYFYT